MMGNRSTGLVMALCATLAAGAARAEEDSPFVGRWHWNRAQSTLPSGEPAPRDVMSEISRAHGESVSWSVTIVMPDDERHVVMFQADPAGAAPHGIETTASARMADETLQATFNGPAGQSDTQTCTVSADRKQMTCSGVVTDGQGQSAKYVDVYDRM